MKSIILLIVIVAITRGIPISRFVKNIGDSISMPCAPTRFCVAYRWCVSNSYVDGMTRGTKFANIHSHVVRSESASDSQVGNDKYRVTMTAGRYDLTVTNLGVSDTGIYECRCVRTDWYSVPELRVILIVDVDSTVVNVFARSTTVLEGEDVTLYYRSRTVSSVVRWQREHAVLSDVGTLNRTYADGAVEFAQESESTDRHLRIRNATVTDSATYYCVERSSATDESVTAFELTVVPRIRSNY